MVWFRCAPVGRCCRGTHASDPLCPSQGLGTQQEGHCDSQQDRSPSCQVHTGSLPSKSLAAETAKFRNFSSIRRFHGIRTLPVREVLSCESSIRGSKSTPFITKAALYFEKFKEQGKFLGFCSSACFAVWIFFLAVHRPDWVIDQTFDLFLDLGATDEQCDFPVVYASGVNGIAGLEPSGLAEDLEPLFEAIVREVPPPPLRSQRNLWTAC